MKEYALLREHTDVWGGEVIANSDRQGNAFKTLLKHRYKQCCLAG